MKKLLLTGFDVWGEYAPNSSWEMLSQTELILPVGWENGKGAVFFHHEKGQGADPETDSWTIEK